MIKEYVYLKESFFQSVMSDIFSFGLLLFGFWFNYAYCGASKFVNIVILIFFFIGVTSRFNTKTKRFYSAKELIKYLEEEKGTNK